MSGEPYEAGGEPRFVAGRWGLELVLGVGAVSVLLVTILLVLVFGARDPGEELTSAEMLKAGLLHAPGFLLCWTLGLILVPRIDPRGLPALGLYRPALARIVAGLAWYVPLGPLWFGFQFLYQAIVVLLGAEIPLQDSAELFLDSTLDPTLVALFTLQVVALAPLGEEMLFRGLLHGWLRRRLSFWPAALCGGLAFGLFHANQHLLYVLPIGVLGVMLTWVRERPAGLWGCIALHGVHNGVQLAVLRLAAT